jgi:hypothetical protein
LLHVAQVAFDFCYPFFHFVTHFLPRYHQHLSTR